MILIHGIKGKAYARKIEKGIVDCRDVLLALLDPPVTGIEYFRGIFGRYSCTNDIKKMLKNKPRDIYINRTVRRKYKLEDISHAVFVPSYEKVEY